MFPHRAFKAFTLIELLVVIGIIGLVLSILLPALSAARRSANRIVCMNNLRTMGMSSQMYVNDFNGVLPWEGYAEGDREIRHLGRWEDRSQWFNVVALYAKQPSYDELQRAADAGGATLPKSGDRSLYVCPDALPPSPGVQDDLVDDGYLKLWGLADDGVTLDRRRTYWCYAYNSQLDGGVEDRNVGHRVCIRTSQIRSSSVTPMLTERIMYPNEFSPPWTTGVGCTTTSWTRFTTRHTGGGFMLMCDWHVQYFKRSEVINPATAPYDYNQPGTVIWNPFGKTN